MNPLATAATLIGLVALATAIGLVWRARTGRVRHIDTGATIVDLRALGLAEQEQGADASAIPAAATLLQFSTQVCAPCHTTHALLGGLADELSGVSHLDVDVTSRPDIAARFNLLQSPTTLILDAGGVVRARIGGAPRAAEVRAELERILGVTRTAAAA